MNMSSLLMKEVLTMTEEIREGTGTGPYTTDAGPWDWEDLPPGEDCGPGCTQLAVTDFVHRGEWDVWAEFLVYMHHDAMEGYFIGLTELHQMKRMILPDVLKNHPDADQSTAGTPSVSGNQIAYNKFGKYQWPYNDKKPLFFVHADIEKKQQTIIWQTEQESGIPSWSPLFDSYGQRVVSEGGYDCPGGGWTCLREPPWPSDGVNLPGCAGGLSIWGDRLVCMNLNNPPDDILAYDLTTMQTFPITDDDEYQIWPRIHEDRVVWQDFRLGSGEPSGSWAHSAVFTKDLSTSDVKQITDGSAVAVFPDVFGDIVIWSDYRHCADPQDKAFMDCAEIYGKNLVTDLEFKITDHPGWAKQPPPRIWGDKVFVHMYPPSGGSALFMFDLPPEAD
jgi:beta propeller repeat protein